MTPRDRKAAQRALCAWLNSQEIRGGEAALLLVTIAGQIIGASSMNCPATRRQAIELLTSEMLRNSGRDR